VSSGSLRKRVDRAKACWLKRVMYQPAVPPAQKLLAYAIANHLNCVTLDAWPRQRTLLTVLGRSSVKTVQRAANGLQDLGLIKVKRNPREAIAIRYSPTFSREEWGEIVRADGHKSPAAADTDVHQSNLSIHSKSFSTAPIESEPPNRQGFDRYTRGALEMRLANILGSAGFEILAQLARIDDSIVDRLCRALAANQLGEAELAAARLAAKQSGSRF
jgi:hypothetical protein